MSESALLTEQTPQRTIVSFLEQNPELLSLQQKTEEEEKDQQPFRQTRVRHFTEDEQQLKPILLMNPRQEDSENSSAS